jgi:hypothetical protein
VDRLECLAGCVFEGLIQNSEGNEKNRDEILNEIIAFFRIFFLKCFYNIKQKFKITLFQQFDVINTLSNTKKIGFIS